MDYDPKELERQRRALSKQLDEDERISREARERRERLGAYCRHGTIRPLCDQCRESGD